jgi:cytochrome c oxidase subunit 2
MRLMAGLCVTALSIIMAAPNPSHAASPKVIPITARRFGFTPNRIVIKRGEPVKLHLVSEDVTHGFFMRGLKLDEVIEPGTPTDVVINPAEAGTFTTICDHFCGAGHGNMNMTIVVE